MLSKVIISFLKIGCIGFGGGSALIPLVEEEIVNRRGYLDQDQYTEHTIVSNITPGALPVKLGALSGYDICGIPGMLTGAIAVTLPGVAAVILLLAMLSGLGEEAVRQIELASVGISMFIIYLLIEYIIKVQRSSASIGFQRPAALLMLFSAAVTAGVELHKLAQLIFGEELIGSGQMVFDISVIDLLILCFFVIFFTGGQKKPWRVVVSVLITGLYLLRTGGCGPFNDRMPELYLRLIMLILSVVFVLYDSWKEASGKVSKPNWSLLLKKIAAFVILILICSIPAFLLNDHATGFLLDGAVSTVTSFGGGEAYLTVANSMFVDSGQVPSSLFYGQILPIANALPGPILVKILSGVGYQLGLESGLAAGFAMALAGLGAGVGATCIVCLLVQTIYQCFSELRVFYLLKIWILPVICGLLISVIISMLNASLDIAGGAGMSSIPALIFSGALLLVIRVLCHRLGLNDLIVIVISGVISVVAFNALPKN